MKKILSKYKTNPFNNELVPRQETMKIKKTVNFTIGGRKSKRNKSNKNKSNKNKSNKINQTEINLKDLK